MQDLPSSRTSRFLTGFAVGGGFSFLGVLLYSFGESAKTAFEQALALGLLIGLFTGIVSAVGKRWLNFCVEFFTRFGL